MRQLNETLGSLDTLLASPNWDERGEQLRNAAAEGEAKLERLVDRAYYRALIVAIALVMGAFLASVLYRMIFKRAAGAA